MASRTGPQDQPQADPNPNTNPNLSMPQEAAESPKPLTLETLRSQDKCDDPEDPVEEETNVDDPDLPVPSSPPSTDFHVTATTTAIAGSCCGGGPKRKKTATKRRAQEKKSQKKLEILTEILRPIPFVPSKTLDFSLHEKLLKRLGLWEFVHLEFDGSVRVDLISQLIATYNSQFRCSYVNGCRIGVNRADLARALKLTVKKDKDKDKESIGEVEESKESIAFIEDFVSNWVLLHEDTWVMPVEVLNWIKVIKEGHFEKVDWPGLIWLMVEKELMAAPNLGNCYYASHMQCLIKYQREELLQEIQNIDVYDTKGEEEEHNISGDSKMAADGIDEFHGRSQLEEHNIELSLSGPDNLMNKDDVEKEAVGDEDVMDCEESKGDEQHGQWNTDGDSNMDVGGENFLRRCNLGDVGTVDMEEEKKEEKGEEREEREREVGGEMEEGEEGGEEEEQDEQEEQHEEGFPVSPKGDNLEGVHSTNLLEAMETADLPFTTGLQIRDNTSGQFLESGVDAQTVPGVSSFLSNVNKREIDHENDLSRHALNGSNKRLRTDGQWVDKSFDFDMCVEQMQHWMDKARMLYATKEQAHVDSSMSQQMLLDELHRRDSIIEHLQKVKYEEQHKRQMEVYRLERELYLMENLLDGYRKALKETNRAFAEYRTRCPLPDEPLYKDVSGSGGLVLSTMELEKQRQKQEEEERINRLLIEKKIKDFEAGWIDKFDAHKDAVSLLRNRLIDAENDVKHLKEVFANRKVSDTHECLPDEL